MKDYRSGGTSWAVIINQQEAVIYNHFHIKAEQAVVLIEQLLTEDNLQ